MAKRPSLKGNIATPGAAAQKAAQVVQRLTGRDASPAESEDAETTTASFVLPLDMVDLLSDLAALRLKRDKLEKRALRRLAKRQGEPVRGGSVKQARRSASAIVREALDAHKPAIEAELAELRQELGE